jgi:hemerythrin
MAFFQWNPECSVGVAEMDRQHRALAEIINRLHETMKHAAPRPALTGIR